MKIIVSHDVDHLYRKDHFRDLFLVKLFIRTILELILRKISLKEFFKRLSFFYKKRLNNIEDLVLFNEIIGFKSTFFFGTSNGLYLNYKENDFPKYVSYLKNKSFDVGVHGIEFEDREKMKKEHEIMCKYLKNDFGIRMHYLRRDENTTRKMGEIGYLYDCTEYSENDPYYDENIWQFPIQIMDTYLFYKNGVLATSSEEAVKLSIEKIEKAKSEGRKYFSILFHDVYYTENFGRIKDWYEKLMIYLKDQGYEFITFDEVIRELKN